MATRNEFHASDDVIRPIVAIRVVDVDSGRSFITNAMLDSGSDCDVISEKIVNSLNMITVTKRLAVCTMDNYNNQDRKLVNLRLKSLDRQYVVRINKALVGKLLTSSSNIPPRETQYLRLQLPPRLQLYRRRRRSRVHRLRLQ